MLRIAGRVLGSVLVAVLTLWLLTYLVGAGDGISNLGPAFTPGQNLITWCETSQTWTADAQRVDRVGVCRSAVIRADNLTAAGNYVFFGGSGNIGQGLLVADVSDPSDPILVDYLKLASSANDVAVSGTYAYVADWYQLTVIDISDIDTDGYGGDIIVVGSLGQQFRPLTVAISGTYVYVGNKHGVRVIDVSDPTKPVPADNPGDLYTTPGEVQAVVLSGDYAYIADQADPGEGGGLRIVDVSDPSAIVEVGLYSSGARDVDVSGNYAYLAASNKLHIIDVSVVTNPVQVGLWEKPSGVYPITKVALSGKYVYVNSRETGLRVLDVADPSKPVEVGWYYESPGVSMDVATDGDNIYLTHESTPSGKGYGGFLILRHLSDAVYLPVVVRNY
jgi:hypothetical protein